jgi:hypothetical protein
VLTRYARNRRLGDAIQLWPSARSKAHPAPALTYDALHTGGIGHQAALRQFLQPPRRHPPRLLKTRTHYDEHTARTPSSPRVDKQGSWDVCRPGG